MPSARSSGAAHHHAGAAASKPSGLLVYMSGKRVSRARLLEEQVSGLVEQMRSLARENALLRHKEAMQMQLLTAYEASMHHIAVLLVQTAEEGQDLSLLTAAMMDLQAQTLMHQLRGGAAASTSGGGDAPESCSKGSQCSCGSCDACCASKAGRAAGGSGSSSPPMTRTQKLWGSVTPEAVLAFKGITTLELAEKFKAAIMRIALVKECSRNSEHARLADDLESAAEAFGLLTILSWVAADKQLLEFTCLNLETMQPEEAPPQLWPEVVHRLALRPEQRQQAYLAFDCYRSRRTALLQQQEELLQELQAVLGDDESWGPQGPAAAPAAAESPAAPAPSAAAGDCQRTTSSSSTGNRSQGDAAGAGAGLSGPVCIIKQEAADSAPQSLPAATRSAQRASDSNSAHSSSSRSCNDSAQGLGLAGLCAVLQAEDLCDRLARNTRLQREYSRQMVLLYIDLLDVEQHVTAVMTCYPHNVKAPAVLACIWEQENGRLQSP